VLPVEDAGHDRAAEPAQLAVRFDGADGGLNVVARAPGGEQSGE